MPLSLGYYFVLYQPAPRPVHDFENLAPATRRYSGQFGVKPQVENYPLAICRDQLPVPAPRRPKFQEFFYSLSLSLQFFRTHPLSHRTVDIMELYRLAILIPASRRTLARLFGDVPQFTTIPASRRLFAKLWHIVIFSLNNSASRPTTSCQHCSTGVLLQVLFTHPCPAALFLLHAGAWPKSRPSSIKLAISSYQTSTSTHVGTFLLLQSDRTLSLRPLCIHHLCSLSSFDAAPTTGFFFVSHQLQPRASRLLHY